MLLSLNAKPCDRAFYTLAAGNPKNIDILPDLENVTYFDFSAKNTFYIIVLRFGVLARNCDFKNERDFLGKADRIRRHCHNRHHGTCLAKEGLGLCKGLLSTAWVKFAR